MQFNWRWCRSPDDQQKVLLEIVRWVEEARRDGETWVGRWNAEQLASELQMARLAVREVVDPTTSAIELAGVVFFRDLPQAWEISLTMVNRRMRGQRNFENLLASVVADFEAQGVGKEIWLEVRADNRSAITAYNRSGFLVSGRRKAYYGDGSDALVMTRPVRASAGKRGNI